MAFDGTRPRTAPDEDRDLVYCPDEDLVGFDEQDLTRPAYRHRRLRRRDRRRHPLRLAAREQLGLSIDDEDAVRSAVCLTGWYAAQVYNRTGRPGVLISPGDIDESVQFLLTYGDDPDVLPDADLTGFQLVDLFRARLRRGRRGLRRRRLRRAQNSAAVSCRRAAPTRGSSSPTTANSSTRCWRAGSRSSPAVRRTTSSSRSKAASMLPVPSRKSAARVWAVDVVGRGVGGGERVGSGLVGPAEQLHLAQRQPGLRVVGLGVEDRLVGRLGAGEVAALERLLGGVQPRVLGDLGGVLGLGPGTGAAGGRAHQLGRRTAGPAPRGSRR